MNYIRNAFSSASQYYTSLPPINPSTLTGAIDVIVIERESEEHPGETELACSPFHVRFGKWQAFRPSDKQVNVLVNGESIPFNMKIGEAGEAFFVFETDGNVPEHLLTSPLLEATNPGERDVDRHPRRSQTSPSAHTADTANVAANADPSFLDLESGELPASRAQSPISSRSASPTPYTRRHTIDRDTAIHETTDEDADAEDHSTPPTSTPTSRKSSGTAYEQQQIQHQHTTASPSSFLSSLVLPSRSAAKASPDLENGGQKGDKSTDTNEGGESQPQKQNATTLRSSVQSVGATLSHGPSAVAANIAKAKNVVAKGVMAAHPVESFNTLRRRGIATRIAAGDLESAMGGGEGDEVGGEPTYGNDVVVDMAGYHSKKGSDNHVDTNQALQSDGEDDFRLDPCPSKQHDHNFDTMPHSRRRQFITPSPPNDTQLVPRSPTSMLTSATNDTSLTNSDSGNRNDADSSGSHSPPRLHPHQRMSSLRAGSEPPELRLPSSDIPVSSSPPDTQGMIGMSLSASASMGRAMGAAAVAESEYMWEWGAFPQRSPSMDKFAAVPGLSGIGGSKSGFLSPPDTAARAGIGARVGGKKVDRLGSASPTLEPSKMSSRIGFDGTSPLPRRPPTETSGLSVPSNAMTGVNTEDATAFGLGGRLLPHTGDDCVFWVDIEGKQFTFQLSLCGPLVHSGAEEDQEDGESAWDEVDQASRFENAKVDFPRLTADDSLLDREDLVMKWGTTYVSRGDASPLFSALRHWRGSIGIPAAGSQQPLTHSRGSSWTRWWPRRGNSSSSRVAARQDSTLTTKTTSSQPPPSAPSATRPNIPVSITTPAEATTVEAKPSSSLPTSPVLSSRIPSRPSSPQQQFVKTLRLTSDQLKQLNLQKGANTITFSLSASGTVACTAKIYLWDSSDLIVVSDIDGTITKSDALGHVFTMIGRDWTHVGVAKLYTDVARNGYNIMYLTSRAIGQADSTRDYLKGIKQNNHQLPEGPVIMSPDRLMASLHREVIMRKPEVFKMACLRDIQKLFGPKARGHFYAGFGNRITDALSYRSVNIPSSRIFTIDSAGEVKMELLEPAGHKSSYIHMTDLVDQMFPPVHRSVAAEFTDFNFWRPPIHEFELPDLVPEPVSPALSARSDTSRLSRLRNFTLVPRGSSASLAETNKASGSSGSNSGTPQPPQQKERQSSPLASPVLGPEDAVDVDDDSDAEPDDHKRERRLSHVSMPGSIDGRMLEDEGFGEHDNDHHPDDGSDADDDDDDDDDDDGGDEHEHEMDDPEAAFEDDLLATGEMDDIPLP